MYALWKTQGTTVQPWREDLRFGAAREGKWLCLSLVVAQPWAGQLVFDRQRHKLNSRLPLDYPRINQFPEWFTVEPGARYTVHDLSNGRKQSLTGRELINGLSLSLPAGKEVRLTVIREE
jgi:hypothetical protein